MTEDAASDAFTNFSCEKNHEPIYSKSMNFPDTVMLRHPKGHLFQMKDDVPFDETGSGPIVHNSKIEMKSAGGKMVSLDDSNSVDASRIGNDKQGKDKNEFDGMIIGQSKGLTGPRCIIIQ